MTDSNIGVYKITIGDQFYIGSSIDLQKRFKQHRYHLTTHRKTGNYKLKKQYQKIGYIKFEVLEYVCEENLGCREQFYINLLKPTLNTNRNITQHWQRKSSKTSNNIQDNSYRVGQKIGDKLKKYLKNNHQTLTWFHHNYIKPKLKITYSNMFQQLSGFRYITWELQSIMDEYFEKLNL